MSWKEIAAIKAQQYLENTQYNAYSPINEILSSRQNLSAYETTPITGVIQPYLPMTITTADRNNKPIEFVLLVNPENLNHGRTHTTNMTYTRGGFVTQTWGPNQDLISGTGKSGAFMLKPEGLTKNTKKAFAFQNLLSLVATYRNNGYVMLDRFHMQEPLTRIIDTISGVEISYDNTIMMGHFNNFTLDEDSERPYSLNYNFEFVCSTLSRNYNEVRGHFIPLRKTYDQSLIRETQSPDNKTTAPSEPPKFRKTGDVDYYFQQQQETLV